MKKLLVGATAVAVFFGGTALAADMPVKAPVYKAAPAEMFNWSGWYAGANVGYGFSSNRTDFNPVDPGAVARVAFVTPQVSDNPKGFLGSLQLGVNKQFGNAVYGIETDLSYSGIRDSVSGPLTPLAAGGFAVTSVQQKLDWFGTVRVRTGLVVADRSLIYLTGGLAYGRATLSTSTLDQNHSCSLIAGFCIAGTSERWMAGWTVGGGWEYAFGSNWSAKLEYLYYDLGNITDQSARLGGFLPTITFQGFADVKGNIARIGLNYKFGGI